LDTKPNLRSYSSAINCWAKTGRKEAPDAALKLLRAMQQQHLAGDGSLRPDKMMYETVVETFRRAGQANRAKELHDIMCTWEANNNMVKKPA
jgi:hypothetical protein